MYIKSGDCRLQNVIMQSGFLHTAFGINYGSQSKGGAGIRYLKISNSGVVNKNISYYTSGIDYFYPSVSVDAQGNMFMVFGRSSTTEYASMYATGMMTTETTIEAPILIKAGQGLSKDGRWGEYNGIHTDPSNPGAIWMYCGWEQSNSTWGTWVTSASYGVAPVTQSAQSTVEGSLHSFTLSRNYPNPFNPSTLISYNLSDNTHVKLVVYDMLGREISVLVDEPQNSGQHNATFNAVGLASGVYYYSLETGKNIETQKMLLTK